MHPNTIISVGKIQLDAQTKCQDPLLDIPAPPKSIRLKIIPDLNQKINQPWYILSKIKLETSDIML